MSDSYIFLSGISMVVRYLKINIRKTMNCLSRISRKAFRLNTPAEKRLASWLSFVMCNCEVVTFPLVSLVRCGV